ncbi:MAG: tetratricopeptide repeat protein [Planctomycetaceae bacterium]
MKANPTSAFVRRVLAIVVCLIVLSGTASPDPASTVADEASDEFNLGVGLYRKQRFDLAAETFGGFLKQFPDHPRTNLARLYYALSLNLLEQYEPAREQFAAFITADPDSANIADARYRLGECSYYLKDYDASVRQLQQYLELHSGHTQNNWARLLLGDSYAELQQWSKAQNTLRELLALKPDPQLQADAGFALARALDGAGQHDEAVATYRRLAENTTPAVAVDALTRQGIMLFRQEKYLEASAAYDQILERFADSDRATAAALNSGMAQYRVKDFESAINRFRKVPPDSEYAARAALMTGLSLQSLGRTDAAREELDRALTAAGDTSLAPEIVFERAELERVDGRIAEAAQMYEDLADRWPDDNRVADSLFNAAELHLDLNQIPTARRLLDRLESDHSASGMDSRAGVLEGRILLTENKAEQAISVLQPIARAAADADNRTPVFGQYYLLRAFHEAGRHEDALAEMERLRPSLLKPEFAHLNGALATAAMSSLQLERYEAVQNYADQFLSSGTGSRQTPDVLAARAVAAAHLDRFDVAAADVLTLSKEYPDRPQTWTAILQSANVAMQRENNKAAVVFFEAAAGRRQEPLVREAGLSGQAWSQYRLEQFDKAAETFGTLADEFPESGQAAEAAFMRANSLHDAGQDDQAITAALDVFTRLSDEPAQPANPSDQDKRRRFAFDSGQLAARLLGRAGRVEEADATWEKIITQLKPAESQDQILDEWAWINLSNGRYARSDEIYRRLLEQFPGSKFAGHARLSLAESEMAANRFDQAEREFRAILSTPEYGDVEKQNAVFHLIEINAGNRNWNQVREYGDQFLAKYPESPQAANATLLHAEALLNLNEFAQAEKELQQLRMAVVDGRVEAGEWTERIWVVLAELALASKRYTEIDPIVAELESRAPQSRFLFQTHDVQGRRWKFQAEPDFARAREYFQKVTQDPVCRGTETAARCQFLLAETLLLQSDVDNHLNLARKEFLRVVTNYAYDEWRGRALYQAAQCEEALKLKDAAIRSYEELLKDFPTSEYVDRARERLAVLKAAAS